MQRWMTGDGRMVTYRREGRGPVLVGHPGGPGFSALYFGDFAGLGERLSLVMLNPRGTGGSDRPADRRAYAVADYVADLDELRRHLGLDQMWLLGHSHGGVIAMAYAAAHPRRVSRLILASTLARFAAEQTAAMEAAMEAKAGEPWYADARAALEAEQAGAFSTDAEMAALVLREWPLYFARYGPAAAAYIEGLRVEVPNADALRLFNQEIFNTFDLRPQLPRITAPTLVITGEADFITGPVCSREIAAGIPHARTVLVPDCGHFIFVEARERFRREVLSFLATP